jgi:hypothetical protein
MQPYPTPDGGLGERFVFPGETTDLINVYSNILTEGDLLNFRNSDYRALFVSARVLYGPEDELEKFQAQICTMYEITGPIESLGLEKPKPCPGNRSNNAR